MLDVKSVVPSNSHWVRETKRLPESAEALAQRMMREIKVIRGRY